MSDPAVESKVIEFVAKVSKQDPSAITRDTKFGDDIPTKSIHILQLIALLSNEYGVTITMADARKNETVGDVIDMIEERK